jgi:hypothetical protein
MVEGEKMGAQGRSPRPQEKWDRTWVFEEGKMAMEAGELEMEI